MALNKRNPISFGLTFRVELFLLAHRKWLLHFYDYYVSPTILVHSWNGNQTIWDKHFSYNLVVTQLQPNYNSNSYNLVTTKLN